MAVHPGLEEEQAHVDRAYRRVDSLRESAAGVLRSALAQRGGTPQAVAERDVVVSATLNRLQQLDVGDRSLVFGRIDREDGDRYHIGRLAVSGEDQEPLVVDWRAPVAEPFYRATGREPMGLVRRRHFATEGRRLVAIEEEVFGELGPGDPGGDRDRADSVGPGALVAALEQSRSGRMRDIVATVQKEQDEVIRASLPGVLVVQGGPGTGKTAVALHRAAYLLYTHRFPLERQGVLVVGPNPVFLRYIEQVLPSLGESGVVLTTIAGLVTTVRARAEDTSAASVVKSDARMAQVLARAVRDRQRPLRRDVEAGFEGFVLRITADDSRKAVASARRRHGPHNSRRRHVEAALSRRLHAQYRRAAEGRRGPGREGDGGSGQPAVAERGLSESELWHEVRALPEVRDALDRMWPLLSPEELLHDLFGAPALLRLAGRGVLTAEEQAALHRERSCGLDAIPWTPADLALLDEARMLLGPRKLVADEDEGARAYGHIVVDEAQDLSPMELRMLARRSISGSMTVVGDIAQATGQRAPASWADVTAHLPHRRPVGVSEVSVNYRTPAEVMDLASRVLAVTTPHVRPPRSVRSTGTPPAVVGASSSDLPGSVATAAAGERGAVGGGTVAVIAPPSLVAPLARALEEAGVTFGHAERSGLDTQVTLVPVGMVKGLEFDAVVVAEPSRIVAESTQGLRALYVALTRATRRLTVVHAEPLPAALEADRPEVAARGAG